MNPPTYQPEPGGDLVLHLSPDGLAAVHVHRPDLAQVLSLAHDGDRLPVALYARLRRLLELYVPDRLLVSVGESDIPGVLLGPFTYAVLELARLHHVPVVEVPDLVALGALLAPPRKASDEAVGSGPAGPPPGCAPAKADAPPLTPAYAPGS